MKNKLSAQITLEAAIVVPIVMLLVVSSMYLSLYIHDIVAIKSFGYSAAIEYAEEDFEEFRKKVTAKLKNVPLFVMNIQAECYQEVGAYKVVITFNGISNIHWLNTIINSGDNFQTIQAERGICTEFMYAVEAVCDKLK